jgi:hypothetical protein
MIGKDKDTSKSNNKQNKIETVGKKEMKGFVVEGRVQVSPKCLLSGRWDPAVSHCKLIYQL